MDIPSDTLYIVHFTTYFLQYTMYNVQCTTYITNGASWFTVYDVHCWTYRIHDTIHGTLYNVHDIYAYTPRIVHHIARTTYIILHHIIHIMTLSSVCMCVCMFLISHIINSYLRNDLRRRYTALRNRSSSFQYFRFCMSPLYYYRYIMKVYVNGRVEEQFYQNLTYMAL